MVAVVFNQANTGYTLIVLLSTVPSLISFDFTTVLTSINRMIA